MTTARENRELAGAIWESTARYLRDAERAGSVTADDVAGGLAQALADHFGPAGGVLIVWWDREGLKVNAAKYPSIVRESEL